MGGILAETSIGAIRIYKKYISPFLPLTCRFYPTCSSYCIQSIEKYGAVKGLFKGLLRILRCNQFFKGGFDPVK